jgi:maltodextrin utilization protein YvdJ
VAGQPDQIAYAIIDSDGVERFMPSVFTAITDNCIEGLAISLVLIQKLQKKLLMRLMPPVLMVR